MEHLGSLYREDPIQGVENADYLLEGIPTMASMDMNKELVSIPSVEEIKAIVFSFPPDKATCPDGFSANFDHKFW